MMDSFGKDGKRKKQNSSTDGKDNIRNTYSLRKRIKTECTLDTELDKVNLKLRDIPHDTNSSCHEVSYKKSRDRLSEESLHLSFDGGNSHEVNCDKTYNAMLSSKKNLGTFQPCLLNETDSSVADLKCKFVECKSEHSQKSTQLIKKLKIINHKNEKNLENDLTYRQQSNRETVGYMLDNLPSRFSMCADAPNLDVEQKYGTSGKLKSVVNPYSSQKQQGILSFLDQYSIGMKTKTQEKRVILKTLSDRISEFRLIRTASPFDRRCTALAWHPFNAHLVAVGSKGGDIILMNLEDSNKDIFIQGCGLGGVIQAMKFIPEGTSSLRLLTASMDGTVLLRDLAVQSTLTTFIDTSDLTHQFWYCSCDVGPQCNMVVSGDSLGYTTLQTMNGEKIWHHKLHRSKVNHTEFHCHQEWLLCTASTDQYVCLWDIRMLKNRDSYIAQLKHEKGVNSAYFSLKDGSQLLTTDQHHELRVYQSGTWNLEKNIVHPHRFYQHLTPMKASWHPLEDLILCGRYPDKGLPGFTNDEERGIDLIDPFSAQIVCRLHDRLAPGIVTLAQFNNIGSILAATMGYTILIWQKDNTLDIENRLLAMDTPSASSLLDNQGSSEMDSLQKPRSKTNKIPKTTKTKK